LPGFVIESVSRGEKRRGRESYRQNEGEEETHHSAKVLFFKETKVGALQSQYLTTQMNISVRRGKGGSEVSGMYRNDSKTTTYRA